MKSISKLLLLVVISFGITACGKSESVTNLEGVVAAGEKGLKACEGKKGTEMSNCVTEVTTKMAKDWGVHVVDAASADPEAVQMLTTKMTEVTQKGVDMASAAF